MTFQEKVVVVTDGASGIGRATVVEFAAEVLRRFGRVDSAILFFAGPQSDYVTGQVLSVSGGLTMVG